MGGDGPILLELKQLTEILGISECVRFVGSIPWNEVPEFLAASDIFILPSVRDKSGNLDGLPTVLLEAMGCGLAIIASDIGGVSLAIHNQTNGLLVNPGSVEDLVQSLCTLLGNHELIKKLGIAARQTIVEDLNWDNVVHEIEQILVLSISNKGFQHRMGSVYRCEMLQNVGLISSKDDRVLDIGCYDGLLLSKTNANLRVGVDLFPLPGLSNVSFVIADATRLPFKFRSFDKIYALDIIEHIEDDSSFSHSVTKLVADGGKMILTTPSDQIRLFPPFLTKWISKKWGHIFRLGYSHKRLNELFGDDLSIQIRPWNAPGYRLFYSALRALQRIFPRYIEKFVRLICRWDYRWQIGNHGFVIMSATRPGNSPSNRSE
jgi:SAM-dependent methyltransferase